MPVDARIYRAFTIHCPFFCTAFVTPSSASYSRFVQRTRRRLSADVQAHLQLLPPGEPTAAVQSALLSELLGQSQPLAQAVRVLRAAVMERLVVLDVEQAAALDVVTRSVTCLAQISLQAALLSAHESLSQLHGQPVGESGQNAQLWVLGMGKLGARELNVSSDIDLIFVYDEDGETTGNASGRGRISNAQYFAHIVKLVSSLIGDATEHGFVFRVDLALRPNGSVGPAAISLSALENYFLTQGREWERFASAMRRTNPAPPTCAHWSPLSSFASTWTTTWWRRCASCTGKSATTHKSKARAAPSAPTM
jgi:[glutamine synthetase] adenylyltransferase / [glutamine synthetase]-adenylyl-L-tyrosine phosphorylase